MNQELRDKVERALTQELGLLPDYANAYVMKVWNALIDERLERMAERKEASR